jgi:hypothetical protein
MYMSWAPSWFPFELFTYRKTSISPERLDQFSVLQYRSIDEHVYFHHMCLSARIFLTRFTRNEKPTHMISLWSESDLGSIWNFFFWNKEYCVIHYALSGINVIGLCLSELQWSQGKKAFGYFYFDFILTGLMFSVIETFLVWRWQAEVCVKDTMTMSRLVQTKASLDTSHPKIFICEDLIAKMRCFTAYIYL